MPDSSQYLGLSLGICKLISPQNLKLGPFKVFLALWTTRATDVQSITMQRVLALHCHWLNVGAPESWKNLKWSCLNARSIQLNVKWLKSTNEIFCECNKGTSSCSMSLKKESQYCVLILVEHLAIKSRLIKTMYLVTLFRTLVHSRTIFCCRCCSNKNSTTEQTLIKNAPCLL